MISFYTEHISRTLKNNNAVHALYFKCFVGSPSIEIIKRLLRESMNRWIRYSFMLLDVDDVAHKRIRICRPIFHINEYGSLSINNIMRYFIHRQPNHNKLKILKVLRSLSRRS